MAVAILAIVIALSSSATAALMITGKQIKDHSVTGKDIKKKTITSKHLKKNAVRSKHVKDNSLTSADIRNLTITGADIAPGTIGSEQLKDGSVSISALSTTVVEALGGGASGFEVVDFSAATSPMDVTTVTGSCPVGKVAISANAYQTNTAVNSPQLRRTSASTFTAQTPAVSLPNSTQLQLTCVTAG